MPVNYGSDMHCVTDITPDCAHASGGAVVAHEIVRALQTPRGSLPWAPDRGLDLRQFVGSAVRVTQIEADIEAEVLADDRVEAASVTVEHLTGGDLDITIKAEGDDGPFPDIVLSVTEMTVQLLSGAA